MKKTLIAQILLLLYMAAVFFVCFGHIDNNAVKLDRIFGIETDKLIHGILFLPFPILVYLSFGSRSKNAFESLCLATGLFLTGALIAAATEYFQGFTTYRSSDIRDFYADSIGLGIASVAVLITDIRRHRKKSGRK